MGKFEKDAERLIGLFLILIPDPATTLGGIALVADSYGIVDGILP